MPISTNFKEKQRYPAETRASQYWHIPRGISISKMDYYFWAQKIKGICEIKQTFI